MFFFFFFCYCVEGVAHILNTSEPIQSTSAAYSKDPFLTAHSNNAPKDCHVGFAHFGPVSFDHPQFFWVALVACMICSFLIVSRYITPEVKFLWRRISRCSFFLTVTLASVHQAASLIGRWLTADNWLAWKEVLTLTVFLPAPIACVWWLLHARCRLSL